MEKKKKLRMETHDQSHPHAEPEQRGTPEAEPKNPRAQETEAQLLKALKQEVGDSRVPEIKLHQVYDKQGAAEMEVPKLPRAHIHTSWKDSQNAILERNNRKQETQKSIKQELL